MAAQGVLAGQPTTTTKEADRDDFTRPTIVAAIEFLGEMLSQANFDQLVVRLGLDDEIPQGPAKSVTAKIALLARIVNQRYAGRQYLGRFGNSGRSCGTRSSGSDRAPVREGRAGAVSARAGARWLRCFMDRRGANAIAALSVAWRSGSTRR